MCACVCLFSVFVCFVARVCFAAPLSSLFLSLSLFLCFPSSPSRIEGPSIRGKGIEEGREGRRRRKGGEELARCQGRGAGALPRGEREGGERKKQD